MPNNAEGSARWLPPLFRVGQLVVMLAGCLALGLGTARAEPTPFASGIASAVIPGAGQLLNGDYREAALHVGIFGVAVYGALHYRDKDDFLDEDARYDEDNEREYINKTTLRYDYAVRLATDITLYSSYAAYREARAQNNDGYRTPVPQESLKDLAVAPFRWRYLSRPTTFIPLALQAAAVFAGGSDYGIYRARDVSEGDLHTFNFFANELTAVGEEAFFRGFLNNELSSSYGNQTGLLMSSAIFGLAHTGQGQTANALQAAAAGVYLGWLHQRNGFEVGEGVALHYWINVLAGIAAIRNGDGAQLISFKIPF